MNRKAIIVICIILASLVFLVVLSKRSEKDKKEAPSAPNRSQLKQPATSISAIPQKGEVTVGEKFSVDIKVTTGNNQVTGVQLELSYDPAVIVIDSISEGDFFANPIILANKQDAKKGEIIFAVSSFDGKKGQGTLAKLSARALKKTNGQEQVITIEPSTLVTEIDNAKSVLRTRTGAFLVIR